MLKNKLINQLSAQSQNKLKDYAESFDLVNSQVIGEVDSSVEFVYFPTNGYLSVIQELEKDQSIEVGLIGAEGYIGGDLGVGNKTNPFKIIVQGEGTAWRVSAKEFLKMVDEDNDIKSMANRYLGFRVRQMGLAIACGHFHGIQARLAKWILMSQDRSESQEFSMTQEFISLMLGVRRVGVSGIANEFKRKGLIDYSRGELRVLNRNQLEGLACSCYNREKDLYAKCLQRRD